MSFEEELHLDEHYIHEKCVKTTDFTANPDVSLLLSHQVSVKKSPELVLGVVLSHKSQRNAV